jgi:hopanoid-associated phosphorylase
VIVAVTGLQREARVISRPKTITVVGGGNRLALESRILAALEAGAKQILSIGICGALSPRLKVGDCIVASEIVTEDKVHHPTHQAWSGELLLQVPEARHAVLAGVDSIASDRAEKRRLFGLTGADAVDMESHVAAGIARVKRVPFAALRIVSDSSEQSLPPAALVAMAQTGKVDVRAVLGSLARKPSQIPALIRTAWEAEKAFRTLVRYRHVLEGGLAHGELALEASTQAAPAVVA